MNRPRTALLVLAYDSQLKWAARLGAELTAQGWSCRFAAPADVRSFVAPEQAAALGIEVEVRPWTELVGAAQGADAVVLALQGSLTSRFVQGLVDLADAQGSPVRPVVVTGWVGVIIEKIVAGYLERFASDVVAVNSHEDLRTFRRTAELLALPDANLHLSGLPLLPARPAEPRRGPVRTILFADQPTIPSTRPDRLYLYERLVEHARRHPERRVLLKPRHRPGEDTFHVMRHHPERLLAGRDLPPNFAIVYEPVSDLLPDVDLMLTVSSTAGLEAVGAGVRTVFVADLGVHERLGNPVLLPSGLVRTLDVLDHPEDALPEPRQEWLDDWFVGTDDDERDPARRVADRIVELADVAPEDRPLAAAVATPTYRARVSVERHRGATSSVESALTLPVARLARNGRARGRLVHVGHALLPSGWTEWAWIGRLRPRV